MSFKRRKKFNPKRVICTAPSSSWLADVLAKVEYTGNPEHKRNPGDFGLTPPASPRAGKSLCDDAGIFKKKDAKKLLELGIRKGFISEYKVADLPQNIWAVTKIKGNEVAFEAQLENRELGTYHGYPLPFHDPMREHIISEWNRRYKND